MRFLRFIAYGVKVERVIIIFFKKNNFMTNLSYEYAAFLEELKAKVYESRYQAARKVNKELILLYHYIGTEILKRQKEQGWGSKVIEQLSQDLTNTFPEMKGFSHRNLKYLRFFDATYSKTEFVKGVLAQLFWYNNLAPLNKVFKTKRKNIAFRNLSSKYLENYLC